MSRKVLVKKIECPGCGADLRFCCEKLSCSYCGYTQEVEAIPYQFHFIPLQEAPPVEEEKLFRCVSCGAEFETDSVAQLCPYCSTALIGEFLNPLKPLNLIPFQMDKKEASLYLKKHIGSIWFAPNDFKEGYKQYKDFIGFYYPLWLFNTKVTVSYEGERGVYYYVTVTRYMEGRPVRMQERRVEWYPVSGVIDLNFRFIKVMGKRDADPRISNLRWDYNYAIQLDERFLSGYEAKEYNFSPPQAFELAKASLHPRIRTAIRADIGGDTQRIFSYQPYFYDTTQEYTLVPFFYTSIKWKNKEYEFFINAQTGEVIGERPYSWIKIVFVVLIGLGFLTALLYLAERYSY